ncbi:MAG: hypothetical protein K5945_07335, partial [Bacteroidaceae bacterium]|nr:hypothetical protein [Bacteroidaceae bacterium]
MRKLLLLLLTLSLALSSIAAKPTDLRMCKGFDRAVPVWADGREREQNLYLAFRCVMECGRHMPPTVVRLAASTNYRLTVNGKFVAHGPCVAAHDFYRI